MRILFTMMVWVLFFAGRVDVEVLSKEIWTKKGYKIEGQWSFLEKEEEKFIQLHADFKTREGSDLKIFLSPKKIEELNNKNALKRVGFMTKLKAFKGEVLDKVPQGVDLTKYRSILIYCEKFSKLWGGANL